MIRRLLSALTDGRPMRRLSYQFTDRISGESVNKYEDLKGRCWLASSRWSLFRVQTQA